MSNSLELLTGPIVDIQKKYEIFSDIIVTGLLNTEVRYMGTQQDGDPKTCLIDLLVY